MRLIKVFIALLFLVGWNKPTENKSCEKYFEIEVVHPGIDVEKPVEMKLVRSHCGLTGAVEYYMDVESVVCGDSQCRIDVVRIYWDKLGFYKKLEVPIGLELEKAEGAAFTSEDYQKLEAILSDRHTYLKDLGKYEVTGSETSEGIDALSGATIALNVDSYVKGAVWTCYTLWHWVNGNATESIRNITADDMSSQALVNYLEKGSRTEQQFALEQLIRRKNHEEKTVKSALSLGFIKDHELQKFVLSYVEQLPKNLYFQSIAKLLRIDDKNLSLLALDSLNKSDLKPSEEFIDELNQHLPTWNSFQLIDLFMNILNDRNSLSPKTLDNILALLKRDDFLIARRAYWFLLEYELPTEKKRDLQTFYMKNEERL